MKKVMASLAAGFLLAGTAATSVSAQSYNVEEGDTLDSIAANYDTTITSLQDQNDLETTMIQPGETLDIDGDAESDQAQYKVQKGDTLGGIGKEFDVSVKDLKAWNDLDSNLIIEGETLNVQNDEAADNDEPMEDQEAVVPEDNQANADEKVVKDNQANTDQEVVEGDQESNQEEPSNEESEGDDAAEGETISVSSTAYTAQCNGCSGTTADGTDLNANPDENVIAVDPDVIPLGAKVHVDGYGDAVAADTGGAINGDKIDLHMADEDEANAYGSQETEVTILDE